MPGISRRTFVTTGASLLATGASLMMSQRGDAATHMVSHDSPQEPKGLAQSSILQTSGGATAMEGHHKNEDMRQCIQLCQDCHAICIQMIDHCLKLGGRHAAPDHIRLLMDCAQICATNTDFMIRESVFHDRMCGLCSEICQRCAERCERIAGDDQMIKQCVEMCRRCAGSCERMASKEAA